MPGRWKGSHVSTRIAPGPPVPVHHVELESWVDPERVFDLLGSESHCFWLDGGIDASAGMSYIGFPSSEAPILTSSTGSAFELLRETTALVRPGAADAGFTGGWVGWFGYEAGARLLGTPNHPSPHPDVALMMADRVVAFDHTTRTVTLHAPSDDAGRFWIDSFASELASLGSDAHDIPAAPPPAPRTTTATLRHPRAEYLRLIEECQRAIVRGDVYQVCLTNEIGISAVVDPLLAYRRLRRANPSHHGGLLRFGGLSLVSSSPETFLDVRPDGRVTTRPIKGTRRRGATAREDRALAAELAGDPKEQAENVMIVDLMRNDLGRVALVGSVAVPSLLTVESYRTVHQLVSTVTATLPPGTSWVDAVRSCLPAGSMTGAPKLSAMTIIDALEGGPRGPYAGAFGYVGLDGAVSLAMTIRSLVVGPDGATIGTGGGITAGSVPAAEFDETMLKAAVLLDAVGATITV
jgi:aminodeoxychorismate synthase component I